MHLNLKITELLFMARHTYIKTADQKKHEDLSTLEKFSLKILYRVNSQFNFNSIKISSALQDT